ncbi:MAG: N-6 DNA methylase [Sedimentisphaerales bacterium]|nr:N-6 DNA methylase [Sedimentisphaerales bacterium]
MDTLYSCDPNEETTDVTQLAYSAGGLRPLLEECGYSGTRLAPNFKVGDERYPLVAFASKPWDFDSACIAVVETTGEPEEAAKECRQLGTPIVWVQHGKTIDWWTQRPAGPALYYSRPLSQFRALVEQHKADLSPASVYRAKVLGRLPGARQLDFVDVGLMPLLRAQAGEKLGGLVEEMTRATLEGLGTGEPSKETLRDVFTYVFRLLAGKILKDKKVGDFSRIDLQDTTAVLTAVAKHYNAAEAATRLPGKWKTALKRPAELVSEYGNVRVVSPESLAYVYEHTLVSQELRKRLGIHATPPYLVDYMVWQLYDWVREIPSEDRHVFEPACGHAPFLLAAMRMLRLEMQGETDRKIHNYLKGHIHGVDVDGFALEIARLSLTLADIPNPNGWDIELGDMYASDVLADRATRSRIMLSNPPYEAFRDVDKRRYEEARCPVRHRKAVEMLDRTLKHLPPGAVFGVLVPQGVLHSAEAREVRRLLLEDFEVREICMFADKVFNEGDAETAVILGRRCPMLGGASLSSVIFRRVREDSIADFAENYAADAEQAIPFRELGRDDEKSLRLPDLPEVWRHLSRNPAIGTVADVGQGFSFAGKGLIDKARRLAKAKVADAVPAYLEGVHAFSIWQLPEEAWLSPTRTPVLTWRNGEYTGTSQVLVNYSPVMRGPWRIKALLDPGGHAVTNTYTTVRPREDAVDPTFLWALLNSPLANAYVYSNSLKRHIYDSVIASLPLPQDWKDHVARIVSAAEEYLERVRESEEFQLQCEDDSGVHEALLRMDAAVMRAYGLPVRLERAVLDLFRLPRTNRKRRRRKGVGCSFGDYFPADFKSLVPLHKYISSGYRRSTIDQVAARMEPGKSESVLQSLRSAAEAFGEDS